jgi:hypothetical protein
MVKFSVNFSYLLLENFSQDSQSLDRDFKQGPPDYETEVLLVTISG